MHRFVMTALVALAPLALCAEDPSPDHVKWMKECGELTGKIRKNEDVEASAKRLAELSKEIQGFWASRSETGAKSSTELETTALALAAAARSGNADSIAEASRAVNGTCRTCHNAHRERVSEGVYKIK
jgi:cytochrome c556